ncbi:MAG: sulfite exporter TauE/SafE family protein [Actinomycetota bacterium]|nr:sulfite exporter TauE/SafE family protein [Actinomycetota bacterium]
MFFVPALVYAAGWNIKEAVAASLVIIIFSSLSGTIRNAKSRDPVNWRVAALLSVAVAPSSLIGVAISRVSPDEVVKICFAVLILALALPTARGRKEIAEDGRKIPTPLVFVAGIFIGALSGLVGVGGGIMMVPLMVLGLGLTIKRAVSTSLAVAMFTGIVGAAGYVATGFRDPQELLSLLPLVVGSIIGAWLGVRVRDPLPDGAIRVGFGVFMVVVSLRILGEAAGLF